MIHLRMCTNISLNACAYTDACTTYNVRRFTLTHKYEGSKFSVV